MIHLLREEAIDWFSVADYCVLKPGAPHNGVPVYTLNSEQCLFVWGVSLTSGNIQVQVISLSYFGLFEKVNVTEEVQYCFTFTVEIMIVDTLT